MDTNRIHLLIQHLLERLNDKNEWSEIDVDLMLDYTRVIYADLLELKAGFHHQQAQDELIAKRNSHKTQFDEKKTGGIVLEVPQQASVTEEQDSDLAQEQATVATPVDAAQELKTSEEVQAEAPINKDIRGIIGINDKILFANELFKNNKFDYESSLDIINQSEGLDQVKNWLKEEYIDTQKWQAEDKTVILFYSTLEKFFSDFK